MMTSVVTVLKNWLSSGSVPLARRASIVCTADSAARRTASSGVPASSNTPPIQGQYATKTSSLFSTAIRNITVDTFGLIFTSCPAAETYQLERPRNTCRTRNTSCFLEFRLWEGRVASGEQQWSVATGDKLRQQEYRTSMDRIHRMKEEEEQEGRKMKMEKSSGSAKEHQCFSTGVLWLRVRRRYSSFGLPKLMRRPTSILVAFR